MPTFTRTWWEDGVLHEQEIDPRDVYVTPAPRWPPHFFAFIGGPFNNQHLIVDMIETPRGPVAPEEVRLEVVETKFGTVAKVSDQGEVYRFDGKRYVWKGMTDEPV